jgi:curli biogenesis system outer membrane secretion channel CsgG
MRKIIFFALVAMFAVAGLMTQGTMAQEEKPQKPAAAAKQERWHGVIVRFNKDQSTMDVRKGTMEKRIHYDSSTQWTQGTKVIDMSAFKEGSDVICLGKFDEKREFLATRVDLRRK